MFHVIFALRDFSVGAASILRMPLAVISTYFISWHHFCTVFPQKVTLFSNNEPKWGGVIIVFTRVP